MKKLWIFGDSYSDSSYHNDEDAWSKQIEKVYDVKNLSRAGSGPEYQLGLFRKAMLNTDVNDLKEIILIFFISHNSRKNFKFVEHPTDQSFMSHIASDTSYKDEWHQNKVKKYAAYKTFLKDFYKYYYQNLELDDFEYIQQVSLIKEFSKFFKKVLVITVFNSALNSKLHKKFNSIIDDSENFTYARGPALHFVERDVNMTDANHMCRKNHRLFYKQLINWIENNVPVDTEKLKKIN
jgi:hypothetical protein